jgi:glycosyltransferase involved in cell wall biosynthesis
MCRLRIAIDARAASHPQRGGFKTYTEGLILGLTCVDHDNQFILYTERPGNLGFGLPGNFAVKVIPGRPRLLGAGFREQILLPLQLRRDAVDVAHFPCNTGPLIFRGRGVVTAHDLIPLYSSPEPSERRGQQSVYQSLLRLYARWVVPRTVRSATYVITGSSASKQDIIARIGLPTDRIIVIPYAHSERFRPLDRQQAADVVRSAYGVESRYVLALGSADPRKNVVSIIEAYAGLPPTFRRNYQLVVVLSHGALRSSLERIVERLGLTGRVRFLEGPSSLLELFNASVLFVFPSLYEGFGLPVLEAMACGTPVITSRTGALLEVSADAAILVDPTDVGQIKQAIESVLTNPDLRSALAERGLARAREFSWERTARQTLEVYTLAAQAAN